MVETRNAWSIVLRIQVACRLNKRIGNQRPAAQGAALEIYLSHPCWNKSSSRPRLLEGERTRRTVVSTNSNVESSVQFTGGMSSVCDESLTLSYNASISAYLISTHVLVRDSSHFRRSEVLTEYAEMQAWRRGVPLAVNSSGLAGSVTRIIYVTQINITK